MKIFTLISAVFFMYSNLSITTPDKCGSLIIQSFNKFPKASIEINDLKKRYTFVKSFSGGQSGDRVLLVKDPSGEQKVMKIFNSPLEKGALDKMNEIYFTCLNSSLSSSFPKFYELGTLGDIDPFDIEVRPAEAGPKARGLYPFVVMEYLKGSELSQADLKKLSNEELLGILYQIASAINTAYKSNGFIHFDLHPGNIMISNEKINQTKNTGVKINAPKISIIDFGLARNKEFNKPHETSFLLPDLNTRSSTSALKDFLGKFGLKYSSFFGTDDSVPGIASTKSKNQDVRFFNQIFAAIWSILQKNEYVKGDFPYCGPTMEDCLKLEIFSKLKQ